MTNFILIVVFMLPSGDYRVAHRIDKEGNALLYPTHQMCMEASERVLDSGSKMPFVTVQCKEVPVAPMKGV
jgi:hypothetical protein